MSFKLVELFLLYTSTVNLLTIAQSDFCFVFVTKCTITTWYQEKLHFVGQQKSSPYINRPKKPQAVNGQKKRKPNRPHPLLLAGDGGGVAPATFTLY